MSEIAQRLLAWHAEHGRKHLPWQQNKTPYRVWLSEIMLQQTQAATVVPYFERFTTRFPTVSDLATAEQDDVLHLWTGLGYYARARNLHKAARAVRDEHGGEFPNDQAALEALPGIGRSTAAAIRAISFNEPAAILDGNVKRVLARHYAVAGDVTKSQTLKTLWALAEENTPTNDPAVYTQAIMDLGATLCTPRNPGCPTCPLNTTCEAHRQGEATRYPEKPARKKKPERQAKLFLVVDPTGACLLERQPDTGVWGGLWSPLVRDADTSIDALASELGLEPSSSNTWPEFRHTFTHYHLDITPVRIDVAARPSTIAETDNRLWFEPGDNRAIGLSVPAVKLLEELRRAQ